MQIKLSSKDNTTTKNHGLLIFEEVRVLTPLNIRLEFLCSYAYAYLFEYLRAYFITLTRMRDKTHAVSTDASVHVRKANARKRILEPLAFS